MKKRKFLKLISLALVLVLLISLLPQKNIEASQAPATISINELRHALPSASEDELNNLDYNLAKTLNSIDNNTTSIIKNIYTTGTQTETFEVPVSENILLKVIETTTINRKQTRSSRPYSLERSATYVVNDSLIPLEALRFNISCSYEYGHATDIRCSDVNPSYSSTLLGALYNMSYSNIQKGKTGLTAWGKASFTAKIQIAGNWGVTLHNISVTGKINVIPTKYATGGWYFTINNEWI